MKILSKIFLVCAIGYARIGLAPPAFSKQNIDRTFKLLDFEIPIRVLLDEMTEGATQWSLGSSGGFVVYVPATKEKIVFKGTGLTVTFQHNAFYLNGQKQTATHMFILPLAGLICNGTIPYDGVFSITKVKDVAYLVNHLDIEEYLRAVLPYENVPTWPDEVHKALCIAYRTYAITKISQQRELSQKNQWHVPYDVKCTVIDQVYRGHKIRTTLRKVVDATKGIILTHNGKPIMAMYHAVCGGIIPGKKKGVHFGKAPYLKRMHACTHCKEHVLYRWEISLTFAELEKELKKEIPHLGTLRDIRIVSFDEAGIAQDIKVRGSHRWFTLPASKLRNLFSKVRSLAFDFVRRGNSLTIRGKGYGHHVGLCQWGAFNLVKNGWDYKKVLMFYYPNTTFMKLVKVP